MLSRRRIGEIVVWGLVLVPLVLWLVGGPDLATGRRGSDARAALALGQVAGLMGMAALSVSFVLSARLRWLEGAFSGLDGMYRVHHRLGLAAFGLLMVHPVALALRFFPAEWGRAVGFLLPGHARWAVDLGVYALWLMVLLLVLTLTSWVPYDTWKLSHKALGLVLLGGAVHMWFVEGTRGLPVSVATNAELWGYMTGLVGLGIIGAVYKTIVLPLWPNPAVHGDGCGEAERRRAGGDNGPGG